MSKMKENRKYTGAEIAVIGMAGRFSDAKNIHEYWDNLKNGVEGIHFFSDEELEEGGIYPQVLSDANYIKAHGELEDKECFDAPFFGYTPKEAEVMDPQIRVFHECAWQALEDAGYDSSTYNGPIGIYGGASDNFPWRALEIMKGLGTDLGYFGRTLLNCGFYLSTRVSFKLDLKGPSLSFFTACSTSLFAIHLASRALLTGDCEIALAGGVSITNHNKMGYMYEEGLIFSRDGHCRSFDARANIYPLKDVTNYFVWRQRDWERNSLFMVASSYYSAKQLNNKNKSDQNEMIFQKDDNWNNYPTSLKRGRCAIREPTVEFVENENFTGEVERSRWVIDNEIPIFTQDRGYIEERLC